MDGADLSTNTQASVTWRVVPAAEQLLARKCPRCNLKRLYQSSGKFRVNANKKLLDIWLIYKCTVCEETWNIDVVRRKNRRSVEDSFYQDCLANDAGTARRYSYMYPLFSRNNVELGPVPEVDVLGPQMTELKGLGQVKVALAMEFALPVKTAVVLAKKLRLPRSRVSELLEGGAIGGLSLDDLYRKARHNLSFVADVEAVLNITDSRRSKCELRLRRDS